MLAFELVLGNASLDEKNMVKNCVIFHEEQKKHLFDKNNHNIFVP